jgi:hypothetical protein
MAGAMISKSPADFALMRSMIAWEESPVPEGMKVLGRFSEEWRERIASSFSDVGPTMNPSEARESLLVELRSMTRPNPDRIHHTWWSRAVQEESPSVRRAVAKFAPPKVADAVRAAFGAEETNLTPTCKPHAAALRWALCLFAERLVGGVEPSAADAPVVRAVSSHHGASLLRLARSTALAKLAYAEVGVVERGAGPELPTLTPRERVRYQHFVETWSRSGTDTRLVRMALWDAEDRSDSTLGRARSIRSELSRLGLTSLSRLMVGVEPQRARWALQHLPYPIAKVVRSRMNLKNPMVSGRGLLRWETSLWDVAERRLEAECKEATS